MQSAEHFEKQMSSTNRKEKIFNVRRVHYKQFDHEKYLKPHFSPLHKKQQYYQHPSQKVGKKTGENHFQMQILTSVPYKQLTKKFDHLKQEQTVQKQNKIKEIRQKQQQHTKLKSQKEKLQQQKYRIMKKRDELREKIQQIRQRNESMRAQQVQRNEQYRIMNMEYFRDMIISMRYQNGVDIDPDRMTYEELLQLQQQMGSVSKGIPEQMIKLLPKQQFTSEDKSQLCSICYCDVKIGQTINKLPCAHIYHFDCIKQWLKKERSCPMCKQEIMGRVDSAKQSNKENRNRNNQQPNE